MTNTYPFAVLGDEFKGKRVLVTGGTKGMGAAMVKRFQLGGAEVATTARSESSSLPEGVLFLKADNTSVEDIKSVAAQLEKKWGGLDILVNNVGGSQTKPGGIEMLTDEDWEHVLNVNLLGAIRLDRAFLPGMLGRMSGSIIHIGSISHVMPFPNTVLAYSTAKAALRAYSKGLSKAAAPQGVRVNMISPGYIETDGSHKMAESVSQNMSISVEAARKVIMDMLGGIPVGRTGMPEEIAELTAFLASDRAGFCSGVDYLVDGGTIPTV